MIIIKRTKRKHYSTDDHSTRDLVLWTRQLRKIQQWRHSLNKRVVPDGTESHSTGQYEEGS